MLKFVYVLHRKPGMTLEEFQQYWLDHHGPLVKGFAATLGIQRYIQVHTRPAQSARLADPIRGEMGEPFDGVAELWFDRERATGSDEERRAASRALAEDEAHFIDFSRSAMWRGEEQFIVGD